MCRSMVTHCSNGYVYSLEFSIPVHLEYMDTTGQIYFLDANLSNSVLWLADVYVHVSLSRSEWVKTLLIVQQYRQSFMYCFIGIFK